MSDDTPVSMSMSDDTFYLSLDYPQFVNDSSQFWMLTNEPSFDYSFYFLEFSF